MNRYSKSAKATNKVGANKKIKVSSKASSKAKSKANSKAKSKNKSSIKKSKPVANKPRKKTKKVKVKDKEIFFNKKYYSADIPPGVDTDELTSNEYESLKKHIYKKLEIPLNYRLFIFATMFDLFNCLIQSIIKSFSKIIGKKPHIITNLAESPILQYVLDFYSSDAEISNLPLLSTGIVEVCKLSNLIREKETCVVIVSPVNFFTGSKNNIEQISQICHNHQVPLFSDCTNLFGYYPLSPANNGIDCLSFQLNIKTLENYGMMCISNNLYTGYYLEEYCPQFSSPLHIVNKQGYITIKRVVSSFYKNPKRIWNIREYLVKKLTEITSKCEKNLHYYYKLIPHKSKVSNGDILILGATKSLNQVSYIFSFILVSVGRDISSLLVQNKIFVVDNRKNVNTEKRNIEIFDKKNNLYTQMGINSKWIDKVVILDLTKITKLEINQLSRIILSIIEHI